jgi:biuret amidohydrolase
MRIGDAGAMGRILVDGEVGSDFIESLTPHADDIVIKKPGKGAFYNTQLGDLLSQRGITHLIVGGVTTEVCVQTTLREANDRGYECLLVEDATESYFPAFKQATIEMVIAQGAIVGWVCPFAALLAAEQG